MVHPRDFFPTHRSVATSDGFSLLEKAGYVKTVSAGCIALLPFAVLTMRNIAEAVRRIALEHSFSEVALPLLQRRELWDESERATKYQELLCEASMGDDKRYVINPTQEEAMLDIFRLSASQADELPFCLFQISERIRKEIRPAHGLIRSRCFTLADFYAICRDEAESEVMSTVLEKILVSVAEWADLPIRKAIYWPPTSGMTRTSYWIPSSTKQCIVTSCPACGSSYRMGRFTECPSCKGAELEQVYAVEVGDITRSGDSVSKPMNVSVPHAQTPVSLTMAGIGISRLLQLIAEYHHDQHGLVWLIRMAPYAIELIASSEREGEARALHAVLIRKGYSVLLDVRSLSLGRRLIDADLIGVPTRVVLGKHTPIGSFDVKQRRTGEESIVNIEQLLSLLDELTKKGR